MLEREFEDILAKYPELIEDGLSLEGRQVNVDRKFMDLQFKDKHGQDLIVELKIGIAKRGDIAQLLDYAGYKISAGNKASRIMLVANRIPENFKHSFDYFGFEYKEIDIDEIERFLQAKNDEELMKILHDQEHTKGDKAIENATVEQAASVLPKSTSERNETRRNMASRIRSGRLFNQAKYAIELLKSTNQPVDMKKIISFMSTKGYHSKTYYDLFNALVDSDLVELISLDGRKAYQLRKDD